MEMESGLALNALAKISCEAASCALVSRNSRVRSATSRDTSCVVRAWTRSRWRCHSQPSAAASSREPPPIKAQRRVSGFPVIDKRTGKLVGILTNRDVRFETDPNIPASALMTKTGLITVREGAQQAEIRHLLQQHKIERLIVVDDAYRAVGLVTVKDMEKAQAYAWKRPLDGRKFDLVIDMQKTWWKTLAVRRIRHRVFISASKHFLFSSRWPRSFKKPERLIDQFMMLLDRITRVRTDASGARGDRIVGTRLHFHVVRRVRVHQLNLLTR